MSKRNSNQRLLGDFIYAASCAPLLMLAAGFTTGIVLRSMYAASVAVVSIGVIVFAIFFAWAKMTTPSGRALPRLFENNETRAARVGVALLKGTALPSRVPTVISWFLSAGMVTAFMSLISGYGSTGISVVLALLAGTLFAVGAIMYLAEVTTLRDFGNKKES